MAETILRILEFTDGGDSYDTYHGYVIFTDEQEVRLEISNYQSCCESWGYLMTEDDLDKFIGAELRGVTITDTNRSSRYFIKGWIDGETPPGTEPVSLDEGDVMFVDIETNRGVLQFVAYNAHNGYYGHTARVVSRQLTKEVIV